MVRGRSEMMVRRSGECQVNVRCTYEVHIKSQS